MICEKSAIMREDTKFLIPSITVRIYPSESNFSGKFIAVKGSTLISTVIFYLTVVNWNGWNGWNRPQLMQFKLWVWVVWAACVMERLYLYTGKTWTSWFSRVLVAQVDSAINSRNRHFYWLATTQTFNVYRRNDSHTPQSWWS